MDDELTPDEVLAAQTAMLRLGIAAERPPELSEEVAAVLRAAKLLDRGKLPEEILDEIENFKKLTRMWATIVVLKAGVAHRQQEVDACVIARLARYGLGK